MEWAILGLFVFGLLMVFTMWQGARAQIKYRQEVQAGNMAVIQEILSGELERWRNQRPPKGLPAPVWYGVRSLEIAELGPTHIHVNTSAEGQYRMVDGRWQEVSTPLDDGMAIAAKALEMLLYDLPHFRPQQVRIDLYTTFRASMDDVARGCILSCSANRDDARLIDWDEATSREIVESLGCRYKLNEQGKALPIDIEDIRIASQPTPLPPWLLGSNGE